jgi:hypothetical protein
VGAGQLCGHGVNAAGKARVKQAPGLYAGVDPLVSCVLDSFALVGLAVVDAFASGAVDAVAAGVVFALDELGMRTVRFGVAFL